MGGHILSLVLVSLFAVMVYQNGYHASLRKKNRVFLTLSGLCCFFFIVCRSTFVGLDTSVYKYYFDALDLNTAYFQSLQWEPLFMLINRFAMLFREFRIVLVICGAITVIGFCRFAYKVTTAYGQSAYWFIFFYMTLNLYFNSMHLLRQMCALAITINIYPTLMEDRSRKAFVKAAILLALGLLFHFSAIFALAYVLPLLTKVDKRTIMRVIVVSIIFMVAYTVGQRLLLLIPRLQRYIDDDRLSESNAGVFSAVMILLKMAMIGFSLRLDPSLEENKALYRLTYLVVFSTAMFILQFFSQFALRLGYYFDVFMLLYFPEFTNRTISTRSRKIMYAVFFLFGLTYFIYMIAIGGRKSNRGTVPYTFFWQDP